jgi:poly(ADP-ribose) glycohydrolase
VRSDNVNSLVPTGSVVFSRNCFSTMPDFSTSSKLMNSIICHEKGSIEDALDSRQVDFANAFIGGGAISYGCVQEEIRFCINPECIVARLFCYVMNGNESIVILGAEQFSAYTGYAFSLGYGGDYNDPNIDENGNIKTEIVGIDALIFRSGQQNIQWDVENINRELNKAFVGFYGSDKKSIATGNWGCGAFLGDKELKSMIQWIACVEGDHKMIYYTFGDAKLSKGLVEISAFILERKLTVSQLYGCLAEIHKGKTTDLPSTFNFIKTYFK